MSLGSLLHSDGAHNYDVTQQAPWWPPCGVRTTLQKYSQIDHKFKHVWNYFLRGLGALITFQPKHTIAMNFVAHFKQHP